MSEKQIQITPILSLLDLNGSQSNFSVRGHIQANGDFQYTMATQKQMDDGTITFHNSSNGYAMVSASSNPGQPYQSYYMVVKSDKPVDGKFWVEQSPLSGSTVPKSKITKSTDRQSGRNLSALVWIILLIVVVFILARRK